jgi:predicted membrane protein
LLAKVACVIEGSSKAFRFSSFAVFPIAMSFAFNLLSFAFAFFFAFTLTFALYKKKRLASARW